MLGFDRAWFNRACLAWDDDTQDGCVILWSNRVTGTLGWSLAVHPTPPSSYLFDLGLSWTSTFWALKWKSSLLGNEPVELWAVDCRLCLQDSQQLSAGAGLLVAPTPPLPGCLRWGPSSLNFTSLSVRGRHDNHYLNAPQNLCED